MSKYEFLNQLEEQLRGFVSNQEVSDSVQYYRSYIEEEIRGSRTEEEILEDLGSANSIAKAIIEARGHEAGGDSIYDEADSYGSSYNSSYGGSNSGGYDDGHAEYDSDAYGKGYGTENQYGGKRSNVRVFRTDGWKGTAFLIGILLVAVILLVFAFRVIAVLLPFIIPFALIVFLIKLVTGKR